MIASSPHIWIPRPFGKRFDALLMAHLKKASSGHLHKSPSSGHLSKGCPPGGHTCADCPAASLSCFSCFPTQPLTYTATFSGVTMPTLFACFAATGGAQSFKLEAGTINGTWLLSHFSGCVWGYVGTGMSVRAYTNGTCAGGGSLTSTGTTILFTPGNPGTLSAEYQNDLDIFGANMTPADPANVCCTTYTGTSSMSNPFGTSPSGCSQCPTAGSVCAGNGGSASVVPC